MRRLFFQSLFIFFLSLLPSVAHAASLQLTPSTQTPDPRSTFTVKVSVTSSDRSVNAVSGVILFPADKLQVESVLYTGSILGLWVQEPVFSNTEGRISFEGVVLNPGYIGSGGKILTVTFYAKGTGSARVSFLSGSVLANDGKGTNVLTALAGTSVTIGPPKAGDAPSTTGDQAQTAPAQRSPLPSAPVVRSTSHPNAEQWYSENAVGFQWDLPGDVNAVRLLLDQNATTQPTVTYAQRLGSKTIEGVDDGIWYFHIQFRNATGWGATTHRAVRVDATPPESLLIERVDEGGQSASFTLQAKDALSGIDRFEIQTDSEAPQVWPNAGAEAFTFGTTALEAGPHTFTVTAYDKAGNGLSESAAFSVSVGLDAPMWTSYPKSIQAGEPLVVKGLAASSSRLTVWLQRGDGKPADFQVTADEDGVFTFVTRGTMEVGPYTLWAHASTASDEEGMRSEKIIIQVAAAGWMLAPGWVLGVVGFFLGVFGSAGLASFLLRRRRLARSTAHATVALLAPPLVERHHSVQVTRPRKKARAPVRPKRARTVSGKR